MSTKVAINGHGRTRKRSIQNTPLDINKMNLAMRHLNSLKEELDGVQETKGEIDSVMKHAKALQKILENAKKRRINCSSLSEADLDNMGIVKKRLVFKADGLNKLLKSSELVDHVCEAQALHAHLVGISHHVNMDFEAGTHMILDSILLSIAMSSRLKAGHNVAILPKMKLGRGDGIRVSRSNSNCEVWLSGSVDYGIVQYPLELDNKERFLSPQTDRDGVLAYATGLIFLLEAKRSEGAYQGLPSQLPEAVAQAVALCEVIKRDEIRFCLSDGLSWIFAILKNGNDRVYYQSTARHLTGQLFQQEQSSESLDKVREIMELVFEWLLPTQPEGSLYELVD
ncbi:hypothetical protein K439DRAFT_1404055 [Ramaria rubella]|nr:hypothetical protein K439DRAFT_1404055 [Ramaria rubella]